MGLFWDPISQIPGFRTKSYHWSQSTYNRNNLSVLVPPLEKRPKLNTLVADTAKLAETFKTFSERLSEMSSKLENAMQTGICDDETRIFFLNTQDAGRYMAPMLQIMANVNIPQTMSLDQEIEVSDVNLDRFRSRKRRAPSSPPVRIIPVGRPAVRPANGAEINRGSENGFTKFLWMPRLIDKNLKHLRLNMFQN